MGYKWNPFTCQLDNVPTDVLSAKVLILEKIADENISAMSAVYLNTILTCKLATNTNEIEGTAIGIALNASLIGGTVKILVFGLWEDPFFSFALNDMIFLGTNGGLINTQPVSGVLTRIGFGLGAGSIMVSIEKPKIL